MENLRNFEPNNILPLVVGRCAGASG